MKKLKIAIQGYEGSFHHQAALLHFGSNIDVVPEPTFNKLVKDAETQKGCDAAIMAIENSIAGSIMPNYALIKNSGLTIYGEVILRIKQNLMALPGQTIEDIKEVQSHYMAIEQCREFLSKYPHIKLTESEDTALSAKLIQQQQLKGVAAIASEAAAGLYNLDILAPAIETDTNNYTRFMVVAKPGVLSEPVSHNKASIVAVFEEKKGALAENLNRLADAGINLTKLQSYPIIGKVWQYHFHIDMEYDSYDVYKKAINALNKSTIYLKILGTYKKHEQIW